mmetsp:Transcript_525/g.1424  ORF Transcript_525/g.1424 Transcript_525/m.1424 type:complete len:372 (+) Transcript_525:140-1255(+)
MCLPPQLNAAPHVRKDAKPAPLPYTRRVAWPLTNQQQEYVLVGGLVAAAFATARFDAPGTAVRLRDVAVLYLLSAIVRHAYHEYLEWAFFAFPEKRTQRDAVERTGRDVTGRTDDELELIEWHDRLTALSTFALLVGCYVFAGARLYPAVAVPETYAEYPTCYWLGRVIAHHYCLSFGMYWGHRYLHVNKFLWRHIHSLHHFATIPLARATYMDHWFDNFFNAVISEVATPLLIPLPFPVLVASRLFRVCESLEKHSGVSGGVNVVHSLQQALPFAQMPHHHDWHHEGHKGSNYTFASLGGLWDVLFGTRHPGRAGGHAAAAATRDDTARVGLNKKHHCRNWLDHPYVTPVPLVAFFAATARAWAERGGGL